MAVVLEGVVKAYAGVPPVRALRGVDLSLGTGEFCLVKGPSGSGKSTLLSIVGGLEEAGEGSVRVMGEDLRCRAPRDLAEFRLRHVGFVFQDYRLLEALTVLENVELPLSLLPIRGGERRARAAALLGRLGLGERLGTRPAVLSGGEKQRVAIARALAGGPDLVLADEPTAHLDTAGGGEVVDLLRSMAAERGTTVLLATHDSRLARHADRVLRMEDGRMLD